MNLLKCSVLAVSALVAATFSLSEASAKTFTIKDALGEFRPDASHIPRYVSLQELDGLPGFSRAEFKAAWDAQVTAYEAAGVDPADYLPASFEVFYDQEIERAKDGYDITNWYSEGLTISTNYYPYFAGSHNSSGLGIVQSFGESVLPRNATFLFDTPQDLVSIELSVGAQSPDLVPPYFEFTGLSESGEVLPLIAFDTLGQTTFLFDDAYRNVSQFSIQSGRHPEKPVFTGTGFEFGLRFDQLTVRDPSAATVPVPAMFFPFVLAALGLWGLSRKARLG